MNSNDSVRRAIHSFLALVDAAAPPPGDALDAALTRALDELAMARHLATFTFDERESTLR